MNHNNLGRYSHKTKLGKETLDMFRNRMRISSFFIVNDF